MEVWKNWPYWPHISLRQVAIIALDEETPTMFHLIKDGLVKTLFALSSKYGKTLNFTHQEIAEMSGISTETATRIMTQLKNSGILKSARGKVIITDAEKLRP